MLRYRITRHENGRYLVLPALLSVTPISETYATRAAARDMADWLNDMQQKELHSQREDPGFCPVACSA